MLFAIFFVLSAIALAFFLVPWFRETAAETAMPRQGVNTLLFRDRLQELENERDIGRIDAEQFAQLKSELEVNFLADAQAEEAAPKPAMHASRWGALAIVVAVPLISVGLYVVEGQWPEVQSWLDTQKRWEPLIESSLQGKPVSPEEAKDLTAGDYIRVLQGVLQRSPEHVGGWQDLGRAYMQVGLYHFAESAFQRAASLVPKDPELILLVIEAKLGQGKGTLDEQGLKLLHDVLRLDPANLKARMIMGMAAYGRGDFDTAISVWQALLQETPPDSEGARILQSSIERARSKRDGAVAAAGTSDVAAGAGPTLQVSVSVAPQVDVPVDGSWTLFIYAKAVNGMPMPVAIEKKPYTSAAVSTTLDDQDAMAPMAKLSTSQSVKVYARLSKSGQAMPQPGDYMVESAEIKVGTAMAPVSLAITEDNRIAN